MDQIEFIKKYVGVEWVNRGESAQGCDCWGLVLASFREIDNKELPSVVGYADKNCPTEEAAKTVDLCLFEPSQATDGAIMTALNTRGEITHVGRCLAGGVIHATESLGVTFHSYRVIKNKFKNVRFYKYD